MGTSLLHEAVAGVGLIDHHVHGALREGPDLATFGTMVNEVDTGPVPPGVDCFDSQLGFAIRAHCAPVLDLEPHVPSGEYWSRRTDLGEAEVNRRFLTAAGVEQWWVDTGFGPDMVLSVDDMAAASGGRAHEIVRLESLAEELAREQVASADYPDRFRRLLERRTEHALGTKSIIAYRCGFDVDLSPPSSRAVARAYSDWQGAIAETGQVRVDDPVLIAWGIHAAVELGLPLQLHVGLGDRDMDLRASDPLLLTDFLRDPSTQRSSILLLHCYPFERQAGYLTQGFSHVFMDVGLSMNYLGARSSSVLARAFELAPLHKVLYSSDAFGPAELHYLGAHLWRSGLARVLGGFVADGEWSDTDAARVARMAGRDNALRAYPRSASASPETLD